VRVVRSVAEAREAIRSTSNIVTLIVERMLPDGDGLSLVADFRAAHPRTPVLMITAAFDGRVINRCQLLRVELVAKPAHRANVRAFLQRAVAYERVPDRRVAAVVEDLVRSSALSPRETDVLAAALGGLSRKEIADQVGSTENTIKGYVKSILRKCDAASLQEVSRLIWMAALAGAAAADGERPATPSDASFTIPPPGG
jgi:DNA-binding NarL/FixJ family response regulator